MNTSPAWSPRRFLLDMAVVAMVASVLGWIAAGLLYSALSGRWASPAWGFLITYGCAYTILFPFFSLLATRRRPPVLRLTPDGIELAAARSDGVFVPGDAVTRVRVRRRRPIATLEVFVREADVARIVPVDRDGRRARGKRGGGGVRYRVPLAGMNESAVRAAIHEHLNGGTTWRSENGTPRTASER
ncbi:MAG: hypothetical protein SYR96_09775 [Actinomycetota bacterium]|nr:hypothetical protein [Actinomycetota bacterium]